MLIRLGYDLQFQIPWATPFVTLLHVHPSRERDLLEPDELRAEPAVPIRYYVDGFGNRCARFLAQPGTLSAAQPHPDSRFRRTRPRKPGGARSARPGSAGRGVAVFAGQPLL